MATKGKKSRVDDESEKSSSRHTDEAVNALYDIISNYNGIIRRIIEVIEPVKGKWSTRKSLNQSSVGYFASVLKGLVEPLKHLMFQLANINDPTIAGMTDMFVNMIDIIDDSPPFKLIDIKAYKNGLPNVEGLVEDLPLDSLESYIEMCDEKLEQLKRVSADPAKHIRQAKIGVGRNIKDEVKRKRLQEEVAQIGVQKYNDAADLMEFWKQEKNKATKRLQANPDAKVPPINGNLINKTEDLIDELRNVSWMTRIDEVALAESIKEEVKSGIPMNKQSAKQVLKKLEDSKKRMEEAYVDIIDKETGLINIGAMQIPDDVEKYQGYVRDIEKLKKQLQNKSSSETNTDIKTNASTSADASLGSLTTVKEAKVEDSPMNTEELKNAVGELNTEDKDKVNEILADSTVGTASGFIKSDFNKQQYNSMGRPLSNDDKINNDMINANKNWQINNNLPHDVSVGNLNPFIPKGQSEKYSYVDDLRKANSIMYPERNALGADISLLQGPITNISGSGSSKKKPKALEKIEAIAIDEKNDMFKKTPIGDNGMIPEEKEDQFKFPELRPKKEKSGRRR